MCDIETVIEKYGKNAFPYKIKCNSQCRGCLNHNKMNNNFKEAVNDLKDVIFQQNVEAGWHLKPRENGTMIALIHSEISEAMEGDRKNLMDDHLPHRKMCEVELADAIIRILDFAGREGFDIGGAIVEKLEYNKHRADHKLENREKKGGKQY